MWTHIYFFYLTIGFFVLNFPSLPFFKAPHCSRSNIYENGLYDNKCMVSSSLVESELSSGDSVDDWLYYPAVIFFFYIFLYHYILRRIQTYCGCSLFTHVWVSDEGWFCGPGGLRGPLGRCSEGVGAPVFIHSNSRSVVDAAPILRLLSALRDATNKKMKSGWINLGQQLRLS